MELHSASARTRGRKPGAALLLACAALVPVLSGALLVTPASAVSPSPSPSPPEARTAAECARQALSSPPILLQHGVKRYGKDCPKVGTAGPWAVQILAANPSASGDQARVTAARAAHVTGMQEDSYGLRKLTELAPDGTVIAAVNGGYFVRDPGAYPGRTSPGTPGESAGLSVIGGKYLSEPTNDRAVLVLADGGRNPQIKKFATRIELSVERTENGKPVEKYRSGTTPSGAAEETPWIDGINRPPGQIRNCGGTGDDPTDRPRHDVTCTDGDELVFFTTNFGSPRPGGENGRTEPGTEIVMDENGTVLRTLDGRGTRVDGADGKQFLQGTGSAATWLKNIDVGDRVMLRVIEQSLAGGRTEVKFGANDAVVNGGPILVTGGVKTDFVAGDGAAYVADGLKYSGVNPTTFTAWVGPNPRTLAGFVTKENGPAAKGTIYLVTVDGKQSGSAGLTIPEAADVMEALGVQEAINLDGGGSTTMVANGKVVNHPSDKPADNPNPSPEEAQRLIADAVVLTAG